MEQFLFKIEEEFISQGYDFIVGVDEAGRGPLAGPVVAAACIYKTSSPFGRGCPKGRRGIGQIKIEKSVSSYSLIRPSARLAGVLAKRATFSRREKGILKNFSLIRDSKTLSEKQRENLYDFIQENFHVGVGICDHKTIDRINILQATFLAMKKAVTDLSCALPLPALRATLPLRGRGIILIDGNKKIPNFSMEQKAIISGDKFVKSISAASIIAKVTRDRIMREMHEKYPQYNFSQHKGYGTRVHMEALKKHGPCEIHRRSFRPVKILVDKNI